MASSTARLEVVAGRAVGMSILLDDELLIGRHADGAGRLADDEEISRSHARVTLDRGGFCAIEDLGSTNGTFVNGRRISGPQTLSVGDTVEAGGTTLVVRELPIPASQPSLKVVAPQPTTPPGTGTPSAPPTQETPATASQHSSGATQRPSEDDADQAAPPPTLSLTVNVDFAAREASIGLGDGQDSGDAAKPTDPHTVRFVFDGGAWRPASS